MYFLAFLILLSALTIAGCAAYFSIVGLTLLFVGAGVSIIVMGAALEVGKVIVVTFLHHKWNEISAALKIYLIFATMMLMVITSIGIYGYLSSGYNATTVKVQGYEQQIETNLKRIEELKIENVTLSQDTANQNEIDTINADRERFIKEQLRQIDQKEAKIKLTKSNNSENIRATEDTAAAKAALDAEKAEIDSNINKELSQIELYNNRLQILDKEVQTWLNQGDGSLFKKSGLDKARVVKEQQQSERDKIDAQIKDCQTRMEGLRNDYKQRVEDYNTKISNVAVRLNFQTSYDQKLISTFEREIDNIRNNIEKYNKDTNDNINSLISKKQQILKSNKSTIQSNLDQIQKILIIDSQIKEQILHTDVGTFRFVANSLGLGLDKTVIYFIWLIMSVFDPLAVCLVLCFNYLIKDGSTKKKESKKPIVEPVVVEVPTITPTPTLTATPESTIMKSSEIIFNKTKEPLPPPAGEVLRLQNILEEQRAHIAEKEAKLKNKNQNL
jgi:predicted PurR-regulated permease PerM